MRAHRRAVLVVTRDFAADAQLDQLMIPAGFQEYAVQVTAMHDGVGITEARAERLAQINVGDLFGRERIHQPELIDIHRHAAGGFTDPEIVEGVEGIRSELDAGADFTKHGGLFEQDRGNALLRQPKCRGQAADAATRDQHRCCARSCHQLDLPKCSSASSARSGTREASLLRSTSCVSRPSSILRSAGLNGCSMRACARSTDGMISRNSAAPDLVRYRSFIRLSSADGLRSIYCFASSRSITLPSVERSNAITAESRVASMPGWVWIPTRAANCTGVRSCARHSSTKIATAICCIRRNR